MTDQSIFNRFRANDAPYVSFQDDNDDHEEEASNSYVLRPTLQNTSSPRTIPSRTPLFPNQRQRYHQLPENDEYEDHFSDQDSNEAPPSLIVESQPAQRYKKLNPRPGMDIRELTMWKWVNVENLDSFLEYVSHMKKFL